ncbi:MAG: rhomboid family intramembrane serine protease [Chitinophagaceae bacterium]|nr:rhomboid family intramembrane serine protease [Chitinophagaceae bacterium]MCW5906096.1 rhomboid family intramembrane serine protease [Chitinophagaceae bacterium]
MSITLIIIIITAAISFSAFNNQKIVNDLIFYPPAITEQNQWYRFITCGFIHADLVHLAFNMLSLYMFGEAVENNFQYIFHTKGNILYLLLYFSALIICLLPTYFKHKNDVYYRSLGASGAVSAVVFVGMFLFPTAKIGIFILPPFIPGFIFAPLYLLISWQLAKKGADNINHSAHIWGALYGIVFFMIACYTLSDFDAIDNFTQTIIHWWK